MIDVNVPALLDAVNKVSNQAATLQSKSLVQYTGSTRITPFTLVDRSLLTVPELSDALQIGSSIYGAYYLMGIQLSVNSIEGVSITRHLDKLKPTRSVKDAAFGRATKAMELARENYMYRLPMGNEPLKPLVFQDTLATENNKDKPRQGGVDANGNPIDTDGNRMYDRDGLLINGEKAAETPALVERAGYGRNNIETVTQDSNLAVGKMLEVVVNINGNPVTFPVSLRLNTFTASPAEITNVVANVDPHKSGGEIKALYQAGLIDLWDALTGKQAAKEWRKAALEDKTGTILKESNRRSGNKLSAVLSGDISYGDISGIYVISANTARQIEGVIGSKLSNFTAREKLLAKTGVMLLIVVDTDWKRVTIYHHSIDGNSSYSFADLKRGGKSNNHDLGMVLEAFRQGQAPTKFF